MTPQLHHLEIFRSLLLTAASEGLERLYPEWVASVREAPKTEAKWAVSEVRSKSCGLPRGG
jgi:hypothetical protein